MTTTTRPIDYNEMADEAEAGGFHTDPEGQTLEGEAAAAAIAEWFGPARPGRPRVTNTRGESPQVRIRMPQATKTAVQKLAKPLHLKTESEVFRYLIQRGLEAEHREATSPEVRDLASQALNPTS